MAKAKEALHYTSGGKTFFRTVPRRDLTADEAGDIAANDPVTFMLMTTAPDGRTPMYVPATQAQTKQIDKQYGPDGSARDDGATDRAGTES